MKLTTGEFVSNLIYHYKNLLKWEPKLFFSGLLVILPSLLKSLSNTVLLAVIVKGIEENWNFRSYLIIISFLLLIGWISRLCETGLTEYCSKFDFSYRIRYMKLFAEKKMRLNYETLMKREVQELSAQAYIAVFQGRGIQDCIIIFMEFFINLFGLLVYGFMIAKLSLALALVILLSELVVNIFLRYARHYEGKTWPLISKEISLMEYLSNKSKSLAYGKDIRIFNMYDWITQKYDKSLKSMEHVSLSIQRRYFYSKILDILFQFLKNLVTYIILTVLLFHGKIDMSGFVFSVTVVSCFSGYLGAMLKNVNSFGMISQYFSYLRKFLSLENEDVKLNNTAEIQDKKHIEIDFRNVTYTYEGSSKPVITHLNFKLKAGKRTALVGLNGAGKTTIVKLLCGFLQPTEGDIYVNGINRKLLSKEDYMKLISCVFQDCTLLPITLDENITSEQESDIDKKRLEKVLDISGFGEKYEEVPDKGKALLVREVYDQAVDFSGGEKQKLLFARALYKDAPILILDEPTSALDSISENELYMQFGKATLEKTVLFISHKFSSTIFCDEIVLIENGEIKESGTHKELMELKGKYYELYNIQKEYYTEDSAAL